MTAIVGLIASPVARYLAAIVGAAAVAGWIWMSGYQAAEKDAGLADRDRRIAELQREARVARAALDASRKVADALEVERQQHEEKVNAFEVERAAARDGCRLDEPRARRLRDLQRRKP